MWDPGLEVPVFVTFPKSFTLLGKDGHGQRWQEKGQRSLTTPWLDFCEPLLCSFQSYPPDGVLRALSPLPLPFFPPEKEPQAPAQGAGI